METNVIHDAQKALNALQENTIGLFRIHGTKQLVLVVEAENDLLKLVSVNQLGSASTINIPSDKGKLHLFEKGVTLATIKYDKPFELQTICEELNKP